MGAVNLQSESEKAARFSTEQVLAIVTVDDDFGLSVGESSEKKAKASMLTGRKQI